MLIADEPTTALDVTVQAQILELLDGLRRETGMGLVLITHDLGLVAEICRPGRGDVCRPGRGDGAGFATLFAAPPPPLHARRCSVPSPRLDAPLEGDLPSIPGQPPDLAELPPGCAFAPRCLLRRGRVDCEQERPVLARTDREDHGSACLHWREMAR